MLSQSLQCLHILLPFKDKSTHNTLTLNKNKNKNISKNFFLWTTKIQAIYINVKGTISQTFMFLESKRKGEIEKCKTSFTEKQYNMKQNEKVNIQHFVG